VTKIGYINLSTPSRKQHLTNTNK